jgi:hypothetical protein
VLANCDESRLSDDGKRARRELVRFLDEGVDYDDHEEYEAASDTLANVEAAYS